MLNDFEYQKYINTHCLSVPACEYLETTRNSPPSRMVGTHARSNVCTWIMSKKMGHTISTESRTVEKAFVLLSEYDERVLEIWDQPDPIKITRTNKNGVRRAGTYTPDFLLLNNDGPCVVEVKAEEEVEKLLQRNPSDWCRGSEGQVKYLPAEEYFSEIGLSHKVFVFKSAMQYLIANLELLMRSRTALPVSEDFRAEILRPFEESFAWLCSKKYIEHRHQL